MNIRLKELNVFTKKSAEIVPFHNFNYFYGQMGAGKSSIARLIDYCFAGRLDFTPALQSEFVAAAIYLTINDIDLTLHRQRGSNQIRAQWGVDNLFYDVMIPAREAEGEVLPNTGVEVLSDLLFYLSGLRPPRVRRSKISEDSSLSRLSIRDLLWYCYLDQDSMDSSFFNLDKGADYNKRLKSRDVLRYIIGYHQERVSELELQLEDIRTSRIRFTEGARALEEALNKADVGTEREIQERVDTLKPELELIENQISKIRQDKKVAITHAVDQLQQKGRDISTEIESIEDAIKSVELVIQEDQRHLNELHMLSVKFRRTVAAKAVLNNVDFKFCPRCMQVLPEHKEPFCQLCTQSIKDIPINEIDYQVTEKDTQARINELDDSIKQRKLQLINLKRRLNELHQTKGGIDAHLNQAMQQYDSAYLSTALSLEQRKAAIEQEMLELEKLKLLPRQVTEYEGRADSLAAEESQVRRELKEAREVAERDTANIQRLEELFLDCLVRARIPGFSDKDRVSIRSPYFLPEVTGPDSGDLIITSFSNLGSGGKKTLFKCCFAIAIHQLAVEINANLPTILIIDSPMKNISERTSREQFEGFHAMLYDLATSELQGTQFILIDKEYCEPFVPDMSDIDLYVRKMIPGDKENPPLIKYYQGH